MPDHGMRHAQMPRRIASFDGLAIIEDHRRQLIERRDGFPGIALKAFEVRHWIVIEIEPPRPEQAQQRAGRQLVALHGLQQGIGQRVLAHRAVALALERIGPPLQPDLARRRLRHPFAGQRDFGIEGIERRDRIAVGAVEHQRRQIAVPVHVTQRLGRVSKTFGALHQRTVSTAISAAATARCSAINTL